MSDFDETGPIQAEAQQLAPFSATEAGDGEVLEASLGYLRDLQGSMIRDGVPDSGAHPALVGNACRIASTIVQVAAERRANRKQRQDEMSALRPDKVVEWARSLPPEVRSHIIKLLIQQQAGKSGFGL